MASDNVWKLANRLEEEFNIIVDVETFHRTRAGRHLMCSGAYSWMIAVREYNGNKISSWLGGYEPLSKYVTKKHKIIVDIDELHYNFELFYLPISQEEYDYAMDKAFDIMKG